LRSIFLARRTTASSARSIIRHEIYHSGILSFLCGVCGWQKCSGMMKFLVLRTMTDIRDIGRRANAVLNSKSKMIALDERPRALSIAVHDRVRRHVGQRLHGQRRIEAADGRKDRAARDKEVRNVPA